MLPIIILVLSGLFLIFSIIFSIRYHNLTAKAKQKIATMDRSPSNKWTNDFLLGKRKLTDPLADQVVSTIFKKGEKVEVNHIFSLIVNDADSIPDSAPAELKEYFQKTAVLPAWADPNLLELGQEVYIRNGIWISLLLSYKSLPECYACAKGAEVLFHTARLNEQDGSMNTYARRIAETAQFVVYSMSPGGLSEKGRGMRAIQKVRLIHATIRHFLKQRHWNTALYDEPICQEDMAGTLMSFSALILEGLEQFNVKITDAEKEAYMHCWRVIGHLVGLDDDLIPANSADALKLGHAILDQQIAESTSGKSLMTALLLFQNKNAPPFINEKSNIDMMRMMMGDKISDVLGVPPADEAGVRKLRWWIRFIVNTQELMDRSIVLAVMVQRFNEVLLQFMITRMTKSSIINFYIPESLKKDWDVPKK